MPEEDNAALYGQALPLTKEGCLTSDLRLGNARSDNLSLLPQACY
jgi:hypothetical protein